MTIATTIYQLLTGDAAVAALVGTRVYPARLPQNPTMPAVVFNISDGDEVVSTDGPSNLERTVFQIDCYGATYLTMDGLYEAVNNRLLGFTGTVNSILIHSILLVRKRDLYDNDSILHRRTADYQVWNKGN